MASHTSWSDGIGLRVGWFLSVPFREQTYRNIAFLLLSFPLGVAYFVAVTVGLSIGGGLSVTLVGIPLVLVTLVVVNYIGWAEAFLASWLLSVTVKTPELPTLTAEDDIASIDGLATVAGRIVGSRTTWTGLVYVLLKFAFGVVAFTAVVTAFSIVGSLLAMPVLYDTPTAGYSLGTYTVNSLKHALVGAGLGVVLLFVAFHLLNGLARLGGSLVETLLAPEAKSVTPVDTNASQ